MQTVLIIEDDEMLREGVATLLSGEGIRVLQAEDLRSASELLSAHNPDVVVVDGALPDGNGIEWISALRADGNDVVVVFFSNNLDQPRWEESLRRLRVYSRLSKRNTTIRQIAAEVQRVLPLPVS